MSRGKATAPSAAEMLSTMEVRARMFPCSGESAAFKRSEKKDPITHSASTQRCTLCCLIRLCVKCTHPRCCSSVCTVRECCSTPGYCSRCCLNWARLMTTPVTMKMRTQKLLSFTLSYDAAHPAPQRNTAHTMGQCNATHTHSLTPPPMHPATSQWQMYIMNTVSKETGLLHQKLQLNIKEILQQTISQRQLSDYRPLNKCVFAIFWHLSHAFVIIISLQIS